MCHVVHAKMFMLTKTKQKLGWTKLSSYLTCTSTRQCDVWDEICSGALEILCCLEKPIILFIRFVNNYLRPWTLLSGKRWGHILHLNLPLPFPRFGTVSIRSMLWTSNATSSSVTDSTWKNNRKRPKSLVTVCPLIKLSMILLTFAVLSGGASAGFP